MKTERIPDIYLEQYILGELPENLRAEINILIKNDPEIAYRLEEIKKSNSEILTSYPADEIAARIEERKKDQAHQFLCDNNRQKNTLLPKIKSSISVTASMIIENINSLATMRAALSFASAAIIIFAVIFMFPLITGTDIKIKPAGDDVRIKGLDSKLLLYRIRGKEIEELKNLSTASKGDIIQAGYIATGNYRYGIIISIDGRGTITTHFPETGSHNEELVLNKKTLLNRSYELDDSPRFEKFIMLLSPTPINTGEVIKNAKKLAITRVNTETGSVKIGDGLLEFSITVIKANQRR